MLKVNVGVMAMVFILGMTKGGFGGESAKIPNLRDPKTVKIIIFGGIPGSGGQPSPSELKGNLEKADALPANGMLYNIANISGYFADRCMRSDWQVSYETIAPEVDLMKSFQFKNLTDRIVRLNISADLTTDWFDDAAWEKILANIRVASRAAKEGGAVGFFIDNEQYGGQPFNYTTQAHRVEKSFDQYRAQVRKRGKEFMKALNSSFPRPKIFMTYSNSEIYYLGQGKTPLSARGFGLWPAFLDGMMDGDDESEFIDGFERAYTYRTFKQFQEARELIKDKGASLSQDPDRYRRRIKAAYGIWLRKSGSGEGKLDASDFTKNAFTPEEFKHAVYYGMALSDGYIWLYSVPWFNLPKEYLDAIKDARIPQALDFKPLERPEENKPAAYIISAKGRPDCLDDVVFAPYRNAGYQELYDFPKKWKFRLDPQDVGEKGKWSTQYTPQDWIDIGIGDWWEPQLKATYLGYAWYRFELDAPKEWQGKQLLLAFGAVDEEAWIWINGKKAGEHAVGPEGWNSAFDIDVTGKVIPGKKNTLYVRVYNSSGVGGIWKSVKLYTK